MKLIEVGPTLYSNTTVQEFIDEFHVGQGDLIFTEASSTMPF